MTVRKILAKAVLLLRTGENKCKTVVMTLLMNDSSGDPQGKALAWQCQQQGDEAAWPQLRRNSRGQATLSQFVTMRFPQVKICAGLNKKAEICEEARNSISEIANALDSFLFGFAVVMNEAAPNRPNDINYRHLPRVSSP